jgi:hypothetical protein
MKEKLGTGYMDPRFLDRFSSSRLVLRCGFNPERALGTHWIGDWVGPGAGLDDMKK